MSLGRQRTEGVKGLQGHWESNPSTLHRALVALIVVGSGHSSQVLSFLRLHLPVASLLLGGMVSLTLPQFPSVDCQDNLVMCDPKTLGHYEHFICEMGNSCRD